MALKSYEQELLDRIESGLKIGPAWERSANDKTLDVQDPATGEVLKTIADATVTDAVRALDAAVDAQPGWANSPTRARSNVLRRAFDLLMERKDEFALLIAMEMGKPIAEARSEVSYGGEFLRWFSEEAVRVHGDYRQNPEGTGNIVVSQHPVGPCYFITPWNFPLAMATRKIAPAIAAGCTSVIKPAELTPLTTIYFVQLLEEAGLPPGVVNVVPTSDPSAQSGTLLSDPRLRKLSFTGSTQVGIRLMEAAARNVLRTSMELGGNAPFVVFEDADLDKAVEGVMLAKFRNIGQACTAANRVIVHDSVADEFVRRVSEKVAVMTIGRGADEGNQVGPLIDQRAIAKTARLVADAVKNGGEIVTGGEIIDGPGHFFQPTVIDRIDPAAAIMREEIFGPVLGVVRFSTEDEAVTIANDTEYGLVSYVFTENIGRGGRMIEKLESGMVGLNTGLVSNAAAPFGGVKQSGVGREGGFDGIREFLSAKYTLIPR